MAEPSPQPSRETTPEQGGPAPHSRPQIRSLRGYLLELVTITGGVLIALSLEGVREWSQHRNLVRQAKATISLEILDNKKEVEGVLASEDDRLKNLANALRFADELLASKKTDVRELNLGFSLASLSAASWQSAEGTGALSHMHYADVRKYSRLYEIQALFNEQQRRTMEHLAAASTLMASGDDPNLAPARDLESFRQHVIALRAELVIEEQLARLLISNYDDVLNGKDLGN